MTRCVCIHGHFYQPPRENPWLEVVERQRSALPYHDWNERITGECYGPNAAARMMDGEGFITDMLNNYSMMSFDFGPTLLSWLERNSPEIYGNILEADRKARKRFSGHGAAMGQCYNHMIMPLADPRDKRTQISWGIGDFEHRFRRKPEGMWLPETAVDLETLDIMSEMGLVFAVLDSHQAGRFTGPGIHGWRDVGGGIDTRIPYYVRLPSGRRISIFFYNGAISKAVSFGDLLQDGKRLENVLSKAFRKERGNNVHQLVSIATDGETYGHHKKFGEMALCYCLRHLESDGHARLTIYGEYLAENPPVHEVEIRENTSWSCVHGVERWRDDCGCTTGGHPEWNQSWRRPLREALDRLRDSLSTLFETRMQKYVKDPWPLRDRYITLILDRSHENAEAFFRDEGLGNIALETRTTILKLLEMERHAMLMYTSCGWFFDEVARIETRQILAHASRAMQLAEEVGGTGLEETFMGMLERAPSNKERYASAAEVYRERVRPLRKDMEAVGTSFALSTLFGDHGGTASHYCYSVTCGEMDRIARENYIVSFGSIELESTVTLEAEEFFFGVLFERERGISGGIRTTCDDIDIPSLHAELRSAAETGDIEATKAALDRYLDKGHYSMENILEDERIGIFIELLRPVSDAFERASSGLHDNDTMGWSAEMVTESLPFRHRLIREFMRYSELERSMAGGAPDIGKTIELMTGLQCSSTLVNDRVICDLAAEWAEKLMGLLFREPRDMHLLGDIVTVFRFFRDGGMNINLWKVQNRYFEIAVRLDHVFLEDERANNPGKDDRKELFRNLGELMVIRRGAETGRSAGKE